MQKTPGDYIEEVATELKNFVARYETFQFLGELSSLMHWIGSDMPSSTLAGLSSPQKQLFYLAALNVTSAIDADEPLKGQFSDEDWAYIKELVQNIEDGYMRLFRPQEGQEITEEWNDKIRIAAPAFMTYFNTGLLNYDEQIIERIEDYFSHFDAEISKAFGLSVSQFVSMYNWVDAIPQTFLMEKINWKNQAEKEVERRQVESHRHLMPWEWQQNMPRTQKNFFDWMADKGTMYRFSKKSMAETFGEEPTEAFLRIFTCKRQQTDFLFYTEQNPLYLTPIFQMDEDSYQSFELKHLGLSIYQVLTNFCLTDAGIKSRFTKHRGNQLEKKVSSLFSAFLGPKLNKYHEYYVEAGHEQDILFVLNRCALIIEAKADKPVEPRREPDKAYPILLQNFKQIIQKGYDQCYRVKKFFIGQQQMGIYSDARLKDRSFDLRTKNYPHHFSIIVTLERFQHIQMDLTGALEIYDNDDYPWSVCVDDLEMILLVFKKEGKKLIDLIRFLTIRAAMQGRIFCHDETEIAGAFLKGQFTNEALNSDEPMKLADDCSDIFDEYYEYRGLGLKNEKNLEVKTSGRYMSMGSMRLPLKSGEKK